MPWLQSEGSSLKIIDTAVHPLDDHNVPYSFSSSTLLQASRALGLPSRSSKSYLTLFDNRILVRKLDERLTGHISVVDHQVSFILPREFPLDYIDKVVSDSPSSSKPIDKRVLHFMAVIDILLPFQSIPPRAPYTVCKFHRLPIASVVHIALALPTHSQMFE